MKNRRGQMQMNYLSSIALALIVFSLIIAMGLVITQKFGDNTAICTPSGVTTNTVKNESGRGNVTGYQLSNWTPTFYGYDSVTIYNLRNATNDVAVGNVTVNSTGWVLNNSDVRWDFLNISYTFTWNDIHTWNTTQQKCVNASAHDAEDGSGTAFNTISAISGYMGTSGLAGWIPLIIVVLIAMLIMSLFGRRKQY